MNICLLIDIHNASLILSAFCPAEADILLKFFAYMELQPHISGSDIATLYSEGYSETHVILTQPEQCMLLTKISVTETC